MTLIPIEESKTVFKYIQNNLAYWTSNVTRHNCVAWKVSVLEGVPNFFRKNIRCSSKIHSVCYRKIIVPEVEHDDYDCDCDEV